MSAITQEWFDEQHAVIHRNGHAWAKLTRSMCNRGAGDEPCWVVVPLVPGKGGMLDEGTRHELPTDVQDKDDAMLMALTVIGRPNFRPAPRFATDPALWEHVKAKNAKPYDEWAPSDFAAATKIYRFSERKYGEQNPELAHRYGVVID